VGRHLIGEVASKYRILEELGTGGMGTVYKAQDIYLGRFAAIKMISERLLSQPEARARFDREARAAAALHHPNICAVWESGWWRNRPFLAMELLTRQPLSERMKAGAILPGDIKPGNLFLTARGAVKVLDFGLAEIRHC